MKHTVEKQSATFINTKVILFNDRTVTTEVNCKEKKLPDHLNRGSHISNNIIAEINKNKNKIKFFLAADCSEKIVNSLINQFNFKSNDHQKFVIPPTFGESTNDI